MEELVAYDPHLVVGILGGGAGTTYDAFKLIAEAQKYGARAALFGRKINNAENQLAFVEFLRLIADGEISPEEAVRAYHGVLGAAEDQAAPLAGRRPDAANRRDELRRRLERCVPAAITGNPQKTASSHSCGCSGPKPDECHCKHEQAAATPATDTHNSAQQNSRPDFARMTREKLA